MFTCCSEPLTINNLGVLENENGANDSRVWDLKLSESVSSVFFLVREEGGGVRERGV